MTHLVFVSNDCNESGTYERRTWASLDLWATNLIHLESVSDPVNLEPMRDKRLGIVCLLILCCLLVICCLWCCWLFVTLLIICCPFVSYMVGDFWLFVCCLRIICWWFRSLCVKLRFPHCPFQKHSLRSFKDAALSGVSVVRCLSVSRSIWLSAYGWSVKTMQGKCWIHEGRARSVLDVRTTNFFFVGTYERQTPFILDLWATNLIKRRT